jgi:hypothetical protein
MTTIHDSGYKKLFSNKVIFRQLLETFVKEEWVKELDFDSCETIDKTFISYHYIETEATSFIESSGGARKLMFSF